MSDLSPPQHDPAEYGDWPQEERALPWRRILAALSVVGLILGLNLYAFSPGIQRRADYALLRVQSALKKQRPHDLYLPTPDIDRAQTAADPGQAGPGMDRQRPPEPSATTLTDTPTTPATTPTQPVGSPTQPVGSPTQPVGSPTQPVGSPTTRPVGSTTRSVTSTATPLPESLPPAMLLETGCHEPQGWNNCGPATLAMALCFYGWTGDQYAAAATLKPDKDDKNVSPEEMVAYASSLGDMYAMWGYASEVRLLKRLLNASMPVIVETWFIPEPDDEMGHYRLLTGYDDVSQQFTTQDAYQGANQVIAYGELEHLWKVFNRAYVVVVEAERAADLQALLSDEMDPETMYQNDLTVALAEIEAAPEDRYAWFNAGTNALGLGRHEQAAQAYDRARTLKLPWRMLWYQFGPFEAYLHVGRYPDVIDLADANLQSTKNLEESYYYRALARRALGDEAGARQDLEAALRYNPHFYRAARALHE